MCTTPPQCAASPPRRRPWRTRRARSAARAREASRRAGGAALTSFQLRRDAGALRTGGPPGTVDVRVLGGGAAGCVNVPRRAVARVAPHELKGGVEAPAFCEVGSAFLAALACKLVFLKQACRPCARLRKRARVSFERFTLTVAAADPLRACPSPARLRAACAPRARSGVRVVVLIVERAPSSARSIVRSFARARLPLRAATLRQFRRGVEALAARAEVHFSNSVPRTGVQPTVRATQTRARRGSGLAKNTFRVLRNAH